MSYNWVDYLILGILFLAMVSGFIKGFIGKVISLATLIAAFIIAITFSNSLASGFINSALVQNLMGSVSSKLGVNPTQPATYLAIGIAFALLFAITVIIGSILSYLLGAAFQTGILGIGNRLLGAIFGLAQGLLINLVLIFIVQLTPLSGEPWWQQSVLVGSFQPAVQWLGNIVSPALSNLKDQFGHTLEKVNSTLQNYKPGGV